MPKYEEGQVQQHRQQLDQRRRQGESAYSTEIRDSGPTLGSTLVVRLRARPATRVLVAGADDTTHDQSLASAVETLIESVTGLSAEDERALTAELAIYLQPRDGDGDTSEQPEPKPDLDAYGRPDFALSPDERKLLIDRFNSGDSDD